MKKQDITPTNDKVEKHGYWERYYLNGQLFFKGNFVNGKAHGYFEWYHSNGQLYFKGNFVNGEQHGYYEEHYTNGKLLYKGYYDMGKKVDYVVEVGNVESEVTPEMFSIF
jgi:antitoxin component YwqK of YwqJK toxin-antitoxin module